MKTKITGALLIFSAFILIFFFVPEEKTQGVVQKIFYIHVSSAFTMYFGFFISFLAGIFYLVERKNIWDMIGLVGVELGFLFATVVLTTGPIWAKPIWGTWWTWDPRLTTTFLLWLIYAGYLTLRALIQGHEKLPLICAIVAVIGFLDVPLIHYSIRIWRGIHPAVISNKEGGLPQSMQATLFATFLAILIWFFVLFIMRFKLESSKRQLERLRLEKLEQEQS